MSPSDFSPAMLAVSPAPRPTHMPVSPGERLGAQVLPDGANTRFRAWATEAKTVAVRIGGQDYPLECSDDPDHDCIHQTVLPVGPGTRYQVRARRRAHPRSLRPLSAGRRSR